MKKALALLLLLTGFALPFLEGEPYRRPFSFYYPYSYQYYTPRHHYHPNTYQGNGGGYDYTMPHGWYSPYQHPSQYPGQCQWMNVNGNLFYYCS